MTFDVLVIVKINVMMSIDIITLILTKKLDMKVQAKLENTWNLELLSSFVYRLFWVFLET